MIKNIVFDIGGVLLDWDFRYLYRTVIQDEQEMEHFLTHIFPPSYNYMLDLGHSWEDVRSELVAKHPEKSDWIDIYWDRWLELFSGPIHETVDILMDLKRKSCPVYALTNFNSEKFQVALKEFPFLNLFDGRIVSGEVKIAKPDPAIYKLLLETYNLNPRETLFIDDRLENVQGARALGIEAVQFTSPRDLEKYLTACGIYPQDEDDEEDESATGCGGGCSCHCR